MRSSPGSFATTAMACTAVVAGILAAPVAWADPPQDGPPPGAMKVGENLHLTIYGSLRGDAIFDDSRPNNPRTPGFIPSEASAAGGSHNRGSLIFHPRLTQLGLDLERSGFADLEDARLTGKLEIDFFALPSGEAREELRLRHAYARIEKRWPMSRQTLAFLVGQTDDVVSPLRPAANGDMVMWGAGNIGDRRPQFRAFYEWAEGTFASTTSLMVGLTNAVDARDADGNLIADGERSERPTVQGRTGLRWHLPWTKAPLQVFVSWHRAWMNTDARIGLANRSHHQSWAVSWSLSLPLAATGEAEERRDWLWLTGEFWRGKNLSDIRGGINQGLNAVTGTGIASAGGWAELGLAPSSWLTLIAGVSVDDPDNDDGPGVASNRVVYGAAIVAIDEITFGLEYLHWRSGFLGVGPGTNNRVRLWMALAF